MTNIAVYPLQDNFKTTLSQQWTGGTGTIYVASTPSFTFPANTTTYIVVSPWKTTMQIAKINAYDATAKTMTVSSITVNKGASVASTAQTHSVGAEVIISDNYQYWEDIRNSINSKVDGDVQGFPSYTTTNRDLISATNGMQVYNSTTGEMNVYQGGAWVALASGSTQPNSSTTVAGKVETATTAETIAGTAVGSTGANLMALPSDIAANIQSSTHVYAADAGANDTYVITLVPAITAYTTGQEIRFKANTVNTGACTINVNGLWAKSIKNKFGYDPRDGEIAALGIYDLIYDGTNFVLQDKKILTQFGTGEDGALAISSGTTTIALSNNYIEKNYTSMSITGTATLTFSGATTTGGIAVLNCAGDFTMSGTSTISMAWMGGVLGLGGTNAGAGTAGTNGTTIIRWVNRTAAITTGTLDFGGYYKWYCGAWGTGWDGGNASAWVNAGGTGGNGGGLLIIRVGGAINFSSGTITCAGANGGNGVNTGGAGSGGWGGGAGGGIIILYNNLISTAGTLNVNWGNGGTGAVGVAGLGTGGAGGAGGASFSSAWGGGATNASGTNGTTNSFGSGGTAGTSGGSGGGNNGWGGWGGGGAGFYIVDFYERYRN